MSPLASRLRRGGTLSRIAAAAVTLALLPLPIHAQQPSTGARRVTYLRDQIFDIDDAVIKLLGGTRWRTAGPTILLPVTDVVLLFGDDNRVATLYADGAQQVVYHVAGQVSTSVGTLTTVVRELGDGAVVETADGAMWEVPSYDRYDTGYWLPPYPVLITRDELYMINLKKVKRIWVSRRK